MTAGKEVVAPKTPPTIRLSRAIRYGRETTFVYRFIASHTKQAA